MRNRSLKPYLMTLCLLIAVAVASGPAHATVTVHTNRVAWEAALDGVVTDTLESTALGSFSTPFALSGGVLLTSLSANPVTLQVFDDGILGSRELHFRDFTSGVKFSLTANGNAFGFEYHASEAWVLAANGKSVTLQGSTSGFVGFIDDAASIQSFSLTGAQGAQGGISFDNLSQIGTSFSGLPHRTLGQAQLASGADGSLQVSNIGSSGEDGVAIHLGEVESFTTELPLRPSSTPVGAFMESRLRGTVNGVPNQAAGRIGLRRTANGYNAIVDLSAAGSSTYTASFYDRQGHLVFEQSGLSNEGVAMAPLLDATLVCTTTTTTTGSTSTTTTSWHVKIDIDWSILGPLIFRGIKAAAVVFTPEPPGGSGTVEVKDVDIVAAGMPEFQILGESIGVFGVDHRTLGNSVFKTAAGKLTISNLGSTGQDGISTDLGRAENADFSLAPIDLVGPIPNGAYLQARATGSVNGVPEQPLGDLKVTKVGADLQVTADFSGINSPTQRVQVVREGAVIADLSGHTGPVGTASRWPINLGKLGGETECYVTRHPPDTVFRIAGVDYVGDELRVLAEGSNSAIDYKSAFAIQASGIPEFTLVGAEATSCVPAITVQPVSISTAVGKPIRFTVAASGQGPLQYQWRRNGADLADGGNLAGAESDTLTLTPVLPRDAGRYEVVVSNACGSAVSSTATYRPAGSLRGFLRDLRMEVSTLVSSGSLSPGQGSVLVTRLNRTQREITLGRIASAASRLRLFVDKVNFYVRTGALTPAEAAPLLDGANGLIGLLTS